MSTAFANEPILELRRSAVRGQLAEALAGIDRELPLDVPVLVGGDARTGAELVSTDPGSPGRVVANAARATAADVDAAVAQARRGRSTWGAAPAADRAAALIAAAAWLRERRLRIAALQVRECAKPWPEADADVCEAIDFLEYYARLAVELEQGRPLLQVPGERNELRYVPRGIVAVISPWNFPLAIPCGMTSAALAAGNAVVLKPAEQSPALAYQLVQALRAGGVPPEAISFLPGEGDAGAALVAHPDVHAIAFTGSLAVGREIVASAAQLRDGQNHFKQVVAELGGKNCVIVAADADLDEAVPAIVGSAFNYAGQKCSAASRVLVHEAIADSAARAPGRIGAHARRGPGRGAGHRRAAGDRARGPGAGGPLRAGARAAPGGSSPRPSRPRPRAGSAPPRWPPTCPTTRRCSRRRSSAPCSRSSACATSSMPATSSTASPTPSPADCSPGSGIVRRVRLRSPVGNLYINRGITGAMVARQPFGGNRLSGTGLKAGGPDYLLQFVEQRAVSENTMRHGLEV